MESIVSSRPTQQEPLWVRLLFKYGIPGFLALYLVYFLTQGVIGKLDAMGESLKVHSTLSGSAITMTREWESRMEVYARLNCVNTAKTDEAKNRCLTVR